LLHIRLLQLHLHDLRHLELDVLLHLLLDLQLNRLLHLCLQLREHLSLDLLVDYALLMLRLLRHLLRDHFLCHLAHLLVEQLQPTQTVLVLLFHLFPPFLFFCEFFAESHVDRLQFFIQAGEHLLNRLLEAWQNMAL
jgi:hypothetical protein